MTSWFLECQIEGVESKMNAIISDWESLNRSLCDSELDDYDSMLDSLIRARAIIEGKASNIKGHGDNENEK